VVNDTLNVLERAGILTERQHDQRRRLNPVRQEVLMAVASPQARERDRHARRETNPHLHLLPDWISTESATKD
jgi:hypothetical protein